jgi:hypothetical protein
MTASAAQKGLPMARDLVPIRSIPDGDPVPHVSDGAHDEPPRLRWWDARPGSEISRQRRATDRRGGHCLGVRC